MTTMNHCLFENTANDLEACLEALEHDPGQNNMSERESRYADYMYDLCKSYVAAYHGYDEDDETN